MKRSILCSSANRTTWTHWCSTIFDPRKMAASYASFNKEKERIQNCWWIGWRVVRKGRNRRWLWGYKPPRERWWVWVTFSLSYRSGPQHRLRTETLKDESLLLQNMPFLSRWWIYCGVTPWLRRAARPTPFEEVAVILGLTWQNGCYRNTICNSWSIPFRHPSYFICAKGSNSSLLSRVLTVEAL